MDVFGVISDKNNLDNFHQKFSRFVDSGETPGASKGISGKTDFNFCASGVKKYHWGAMIHISLGFTPFLYYE